MTDTYKFKLPTGVEIELGQLYGEHEEMLTKEDNLRSGRGITLVLIDRVKRIGNKTDITEKDILNLLNVDQAFILLALRDISRSNKTLEFRYNWALSGKEDYHEHKVDFIFEACEVKPYRFVTKDFTIKDSYDTQLTDASGTLYDKFPVICEDTYEKVMEKSKITVVLPNSKKEVTFKLLDGKGAAIASKMNPNNRSILTFIELRNPTYISKKDENSAAIPINLDLRKTTAEDLDFLRKAILISEGNIDSNVIIEHPDTGETKTLNVLEIPAFFFPYLAT